MFSLKSHSAVIAAVLFAVFIPAIALSQVSNQPLSGWTSGSRQGINLSGREVFLSSPAVADIDANPSNGLEVAVGGSDGLVHVYRADGSMLWTSEMPNHRCNKAGPTNKVLSSPAVGALYGDGVPYVVIGYGGVGSKDCGGGLVAFNGITGKRRWHFNLKRFSRQQKFGTNSHSVFSSPALADTNGDGHLEIGFGSFDRNVYFLNSSGKPIWYYVAADTIWSSAAFADIVGDGKLEMIIGTDISGNSALRPPTSDGGYLYAFKTKAKRQRKKKKRKAKRRDKVKRYFFRDKKAFHWQTSFNQTIYSAPIVADVLPGVPGREIVIGSGCFFPQGNENKRGKWVKILRSSDGAVMRTLDTQGCLTSTVAVGDINDDGRLELVATVNGTPVGSGNSTIVAFDPISGSQLWSIVPRFKGANDSWGGNFSSPVLGDLDGNGSLEIVASTSTGVGIFSGRDGSALTCETSSTCENMIRLGTGNRLQATPALADINLDGVPEIIIGGGRNGNGVLYGWTGFSDLINSDLGFHQPFSIPWGMYRGSSSSTASFPVQ